MSLTSQIKDQNSPVRRFFKMFENRNGVKECLALLQSTRPIIPPTFTPSWVVYSFIGITTDYLIRYTANGNSLVFENTIAHKALTSIVLTPGSRGNNIIVYSGELPNTSHPAAQHLDNLYKIGAQYLDGRTATDHKAIFSATALAVLDRVFRSHYLPKLFYQEISNSRIEEETTRLQLEEYYKSLGGELYSQDISDLIRMFIAVNRSAGSEFFGARFVVFNQELENSMLVDGADFDCVIEYEDRMILTDIKTTIKPLKIEQLRQIIGYALLYDPKKDNFKFTDIGIYYSRSGSFRFLPIDCIVEKILPSFKSVSQARKKFIEVLENY